MENKEENTIGNSRANSISTGDPALDTNVKTSSESTSSKNSGESAPQGGENIVNEQEQHKSVNMEEYIENSSENRFDDNEKDVNTAVRGSAEDVAEDGGGTDETNNNIPNSTGAVL